MPFASSKARWNSLDRLLSCLTTALLALCFFAPSAVLAQSPARSTSLVPQRDVMSAYDARHLLARLYSYSEDTLPLAEAEYGRLLRQRPDAPDISLELAEVLIRLGHQRQAEAILRTLDTNDPRVALGMGDALFGSGRMAAAAEAYQQALKAGATRKDLQLRLAQSLSWSGQQAEALPYLSTLHRADPANVDVALLYARALAQTGDRVSAKSVLDQLVAQSPDNADLLFELAEQEAALGHIGAARRFTLRALELDDSPEAQTRAAQNMNQWGAFHRAVALYEKYLQEEGPDRRQALRLAETLSNSQRYEEAEGVLRLLLIDDPKDREARLLLAETKVREKDGKAALGVLAPLDDQPDDAKTAGTAATRAPGTDKAGGKGSRAENPEALDALDAPKAQDEDVAALRARSLELLGQYEAAADIWARLARGKTTTGDISVNSAEAAKANGETKGHTKTETSATAQAAPKTSPQEQPRTPTQATRLIEQGRLLQMGGDSQAARSAFVQAAKLAPRSPDTRYHIAQLEQNTDFVQLAKDLTTSKAAPITDPAELARWGELFSRDAHYAAAIVCFEAVLRLDPDYFPARMALAENLAYDLRLDDSLAMLEQLEKDFPDSSKVTLTRARVLAWSRKYDESIAAYDMLHKDAPADPVPMKEMARAAFWDKRADQGRDLFNSMLEPPVDALLAERLDAERKSTSDDPALAEASAQARQSAEDGGVYKAYLALMDSPVAQAHPKLFAELLPEYRIQHAAVLERQAKTDAYNRRFSQAVDELTALTSLQPGNEEAWFDLGQAQCALGLCSGETETYTRLLEIDPQHTLADRALERRERRNAPRIGAGMNLWEENGHGNASNIVRMRNDLKTSVPLTCGLRLEAAAHQWIESPRKSTEQYQAFVVTLDVAGVFKEWLSGNASWTTKHYDTSAPEDTDQFRARLELNLRDYARVGLGFERRDEITNEFAVLAGTQSDNFILDAYVPVTRRLDVNAGIRFIEYSDDNSGEVAHMDIGYAFTDHPRIFKVILRGEYRDTDEKSQDVYTGPALTDIIHPYWTPQGYTAGTVTLEWYEDLAEDYFCGAQRHYVDVKLSGGTDSDTNNAVRVEAEWVLDFDEHWGVEARGLLHRSQQWDANGLWGGVYYGF